MDDFIFDPLILKGSNNFGYLISAMFSACGTWCGQPLLVQSHFAGAGRSIH